MDGISMLPTLVGNPEKQEQHEYLFWDFAGYGGQLAARMGKWKAIRKDMRKDPDAPLELYDLETDIRESNDVAEEFPKVAAHLADILVQARVEPELKSLRFGEYGDSN
jgi:arylsulfatase A-like enzyme